MKQGIFAFAALFMSACATSDRAESPAVPAYEALPDRVFLIGQDLDAVRGYVGSECCIVADGATTYMSLYRLRSAPDFGGLGYDLNGVEISPESSWGAGPVSAQKSVLEFGLPHLAIGLYIAENGEPDGLQRIADGAFDPEIRTLGEFMKSVPGQVFLRIGYEFDGTWNMGQDNTGNYISAYRRIVDVLRTAGVENAVFTWQASSSILDDLIEQKHEDIENWYPGDDYVDWLALSWFSRPNTKPMVEGAFETKRPVELANEVIDLARRVGKPVLIAESAPQGYDISELFSANINPLQDGPSGENIQTVTSQQIWQEWYAPMFDWMNANSDVVRGLAYINVDWDSQPMWGPPYANGFWGDTRLEENSEIARQFDAAVLAWKTGD